MTAKLNTRWTNTDFESALAQASLGTHYFNIGKSLGRSNNSVFYKICGFIYKTCMYDSNKKSERALCVKYNVNWNEYLDFVEKEKGISITVKTTPIQIIDYSCSSKGLVILH